MGAAMSSAVDTMCFGALLRLPGSRFICFRSVCWAVPASSCTLGAAKTLVDVGVWATVVPALSCVPPPAAHLPPIQV